MTFLPFIACTVLYFIIGAFISGIVGDEELTCAFIFVWPLVGLVFLAVWFFGVIIKFGEFVRDFFNNLSDKIKGLARK